MAEPLLAELTAEQRLEDLRRAHLRVLRKFDDLKNTKDEYSDVLRQAVQDAIVGLDIRPVPKPDKDKRRKGHEVAVITLSDWQLAKVTPSYDSEICERRIEELAERIIQLTDIQRADHPVTEARVYLLGDLIEGELIFPGQAHLIDASLYRQVVVDGPRILANFLRRMATTFDKIHVVGVAGNHGSLGGRARKDYHPESNGDCMMYEVTRQLMASEPRITWGANMSPGERHWYAVDYIGDKGFMLFHGDQVKGGFGGFPWYGFGKKIMGWRMGAIAEPFDYALAGHFHTPTRMLVGNVTLWVSGSTESHNTYAAEVLAAQGTPSQWLLFCHPNRGITAEYQVHLS